MVEIGNDPDWDDISEFTTNILEGHAPKSDNARDTDARYLAARSQVLVARRLSSDLTAAAASLKAAVEAASAASTADAKRMNTATWGLVWATVGLVIATVVLVFVTMKAGG